MIKVKNPFLGARNCGFVILKGLCICEFMQSLYCCVLLFSFCCQIHKLSDSVASTSNFFLVSNRKGFRVSTTLNVGLSCTWINEDIHYLVANNSDSLHFLSDL